MFKDYKILSSNSVDTKHDSTPNVGPEIGLMKFGASILYRKGKKMAGQAMKCGCGSQIVESKCCGWHHS